MTRGGSRAYLRSVLFSWWSAIGVIGGLLGLVSGVTSVDVPWFIWLAVVVAGIVFGQYHAYRKLSAAAPSPPEPGAVVGHSPAEAAANADAGPSVDQPQSFDPLLLQGQIYPYLSSAVVEPSERAFAVRAAVAVRTLTDPPPAIGSREQNVFEEAVATSVLESWLREMSADMGRFSSEHLWRAVEPTRSWIVTLRRPAQRMMMDDWTMTASAVLITQAGASPIPRGYAVVHTDVVIRPREGEAARTMPLSFGDFAELLEAMTATLVDGVAPALGALPLGDDYRLLSFGCVAVPTASSLSDYLPLNQQRWPRAEGAYDAPGFEIYPRLAAPVLDATRRREEIRAALAASRTTSCAWCPRVSSSGVETRSPARSVPSSPRREVLSRRGRQDTQSRTKRALISLAASRTSRSS